MESFYNGSTSTESSSGLTNHIPSMPSLTTPSFPDDDSDEWEYEYSTSENEFYYLTLDLPITSASDSLNSAQKIGRGGYKSVWINRGLGRPKRQLVKAPTVTVGSKESISTPTPARATYTEEDDADDYSDTEEDEEEAEQNPAKNASDSERYKETGATSKAQEIQILELHSENPIISFQGQMYSCSWAENIGTELLFMNHDPETLLPVLRSLRGGVDLLAASSARIVSKIAKTTPKNQVIDLEMDDDYQEDVDNPDDLNPTALIPLNKRVSGDRKTQARFLERLMDVKLVKGENDDVTVVAKKRLHPGGWYRALLERRGEERAILNSQLQQGGEQAEAAAQRLTEMEQEDVEDKVRERMGEYFARKRRSTNTAERMEGRRPTKTRRRNTTGLRSLSMVQRRPRATIDKAAMEGQRRTMRTLLPKPGIGPQSIQSTPTPQSWTDLEPGLGMDEAHGDNNGDDNSDEDRNE